jgi:hypothetical protein
VFVCVCVCVCVNQPEKSSHSVTLSIVTGNMKCGTA